MKGEVTPVSSPQILEEFDRVMTRPRLRRYVTATKLHSFRRPLQSRATLVTPKSTLPPLTADPNDNFLVETAFDGKARFLVSGDEDLLQLKEFRGIRIVAVGEMLDILRGKA